MSEPEEYQQPEHNQSSNTSLLNNFLLSTSMTMAPNMKPTGYYLRCRDVDGTSVIITPTATGLGAHTRWIYPEHDDKDSDEDSENVMDVDDEGETMAHVPGTPVAQHSFDAGSVIRTPTKKAQPLQRSPARIGFDSSDFLHDDALGKHIVEQTSNGPCLRYVIERPLGSTTNLSKDQISALDFQRNQATFLTQVEKMLGRAEREKVMREMNNFSSVDKPGSDGHDLCTHFVSPVPTVIIEDDENLSGRSDSASTKHLGSIVVEGQEWQVYKTLRPRKDGQPRIIRSSPAQHKTHRARRV